MASNGSGSIFRITTWGESHGKAIGVVIDGCPAGLELCDRDISEALAKRAPGRNPYTSPRQEPDLAEILSGTFEGRTTGTPVSILIPNRDADSSRYEPIKHLLRPGHANHTYLEKYGAFDYRGGGRASGRETACRVAAGAVAKKILRHYGIDVVAFLSCIGDVRAAVPILKSELLRAETDKSIIYCPDPSATLQMTELIEKLQKDGDSVGGIVDFYIENAPSGLGDPVYEKLEANLAKAFMGLPAAKGVEIGSGFASAGMLGSEHNDLFILRDRQFRTMTNRSGGISGGISTGMPIEGRVAFKPPSSIMKTQPTLDLAGEEAIFSLPEGSRHDPCIAVRAVPVVEAMAALVLVDALLLNRCARL